MKDIVGSILAVFLGFILLALTPLYYISTIQWAKSETIALTATRNLIDEVIDTGKLTDEAVAEYNLKLAASSEYYTTNIMRQVKVVNPDPLKAGEVYTTYMTVDDNTTYNQGDFIIVEVKPIGKNIARTISETFGLTMGNMGITLAGRVR